MNIIKSILEISLLSSVLIFVVLILRSVFSGKINYKVLSFLWILVLIRLIMPMTINSPIHLDSIMPKEAEGTTVEPEALDTVMSTPVDYINTEGSFVDDYQPQPQLNNTKAVEVVEPTMIDKFRTYIKSINLWMVGLIVWVAGAVFVFILNISEYMQFSYLIEKERHRPNAKLYEMLDRCKATLNIKKMVSIYECRYVSTPVTFRFFKPIILVPHRLIQHVDEKKFRMIVLHELCHIKRGDIGSNFIWLLAKVLHWFNPLVWIAYKKYLSDIELFCDEMVLKYLEDEESFTYSQSLIDVIKLSDYNNKVPSALSFCQDKSKLKERVQNMIEPKKKLKSVSVISLLLATIMIVGCFTTACQPTESILEQPVVETLAPIGSMQDNIDDTSQETEPDDKIYTPVPITSPEEALEAVKQYCVDDAFEFQTPIYSRDAIPAHYTIHVDDGIDGWYTIYEFSGELMQLNVAGNDEGMPILDDAQIEEKLHEYINQLYPNTYLEDIAIEYKERGNVYTGTLVSEYTNVPSRELQAWITKTGKLVNCNAVYNNVYAMGFSQETINTVLTYARTDNKKIEYFQQDMLDDGDYCNFFILDDRETTVRLRHSDDSLLGFYFKDISQDTQNNFSTAEIYQIAEDIINQYFEVSEFDANRVEQVGNISYVFGELTTSNGKLYRFNVVFNGDKQMKEMALFPIATEEDNVTITQETAIENVATFIKEDLPFVDEQYLTVTDSQKTEKLNQQSYYVEYSYNPEEPSTENYPFNAYFYVNIFTGERVSWRIEAVNENIDIISKDRAIGIARDAIATKYNINGDDLIYTELFEMTGRNILFQVSFTYGDNDIYSAVIFAGTGEVDSIMHDTLN